MKPELMLLMCSEVLWGKSLRYNLYHGRRPDLHHCSGTRDLAGLRKEPE